MYRTPAPVCLALFLILLTACATPGPTKEASRLQLEAFDNTRQGVGSYARLVEKEIRSIQTLRQASQDAGTVSAVVTELARDQSVSATEALDRLTNELKAGREQTAAQEDPLQTLLNRHNASMRTLTDLLTLFQQNQALIDLYLTTDLGPTPEQVKALGEDLSALKDAEAGGVQ